MPEENRSTQVSDALYVKLTDFDSKLRGAIGGASGVNPIDLANAMAAVRDAIAELEERIAALEEKAGG